MNSTERTLALHFHFEGIPNSIGHLETYLTVSDDVAVRDLIVELLRRLGSDADADDLVLVLLREGQRLDPSARLLAYRLLRGDSLLVRPFLAEDREAAPLTSPARMGAAIWLSDVRGRNVGRITPIEPGRPVVLHNQIGGPGVWVDEPNNPGSRLEVAAEADGRVRVRLLAGEAFVDGDRLGLSSTDDARLRDSLLIGPGSTIRLGSTALLRVTDDIASNGPNDLGQVAFEPGPAESWIELKPATIFVPRVDRSEPPSPRLPWPVVIGAVAMAGIYFLVFGRGEFALFVVVPLLIALWGYWEDRRRLKKHRATQVREREQAIKDIAGAVKRAAEHEAATRRLNSPEVRSTVFRRAYRHSATLWNRPVDEPGFLVVRVGSTTLRADIRHTRTADDMPAWFDEKSLDADLPDVPAVIDFAQRNVALFGSSIPALTELVLEIVLQAACFHSPRDLRVVVGCAGRGSPSDFAWQARSLAWLPHAHSPAGVSLYCSGQEALDDRLALVDSEMKQAEELDARPLPHVMLVLQDGCAPSPTALDRLLVRWRSNVHVLWFGTAQSAAPSSIDSVVELEVGGTLRSLGALEWDTARWAADVNQEFAARDKGHDQCSEIARNLAPLYDCRAALEGEGLPRLVPLGRLLEPGAPSTSSRRELKLTLGWTELRPLTLDLVKDGPHLLVAGTTGSGKSELLQTLVSSVLANYDSTEVRLFLFDFKGGATFAGMEGLASTMGFITNLTRLELTRALRFVEAELTQRQERFARARTASGGRVRNYRQYRDAVPSEKLPRIVVVFEEFGALVGEFDSARKTVVRIAQQGRSLGVHVIIATQRPSNAIIDADVQANVAARIALRTVTADESHIIIGSGDAVQIPANAEGRALLRLPGQPPIAFQSGYGGYVDRPQAERIVFSPFAPLAFDRQAVETESTLETTDFERALALFGTQRPDYREDPAPERATRAKVSATLEPSFHGVPTRFPASSDELAPHLLVTGICDDVEEQNRFDHEVDLSRGALLVAGGVGVGKSSALVAFAQQLRRRFGRACEIVGIDSSGEDLAELDDATFNWIVNVDDGKAMELFRVQLEHELRSRRHSSVPRRSTYVLVDDVQQMYEQFAFSNDEMTRLRAWTDLIRRCRRNQIYFAAAAPSQQFGNPSIRGVFAHRLQLRARPDDVELFPAAAELHRGVAIDSLGRQVQLYAPIPGAEQKESYAPVRFGPLPRDLSLDRSAAPSRPGAILLALTEIERAPVLFAPASGHPLVIMSDSASERGRVMDHAESELAYVGYEVLHARDLLSSDNDTRRLSATVSDRVSAGGGRTVVSIRDLHGPSEEVSQRLAAMMSVGSLTWPLLIAVDPECLVTESVDQLLVADAMKALPLDGAFVWNLGARNPRATAAIASLIRTQVEISEDDRQVPGRGWLVGPNGSGVAQLPRWRDA